MDLKLQRIAAWCGPISIVIFFLFFGLMMGFVPPIAPSETADEVAQIFIAHEFRLQLGVSLAGLFGLTLFGPWLALVCVRVRRAEGKWGLLSIMVVLAHGTFWCVFVIAWFVLAAAVFRPERAPEITQALHDIFWMLFAGPVGVSIIEIGAVAIASFIDRSTPRTFPRWYGYYCVFYVLLDIPEGFIVVFKRGPLGWNGVMVFWLAGALYFFWTVLTLIVTLRSIKAEETLLRSADSEELTLDRA